jgi:hypothetical protein
LPATDAPDDVELQKLAHTIDTSFGHHYAIDPLNLVVVGEKGMMAAFDSVTAHEHAIVGRVEGDYSATSCRDLAQIVWPVVREALSGVVATALRDLEAHADRGKVAFGLEAVVRQISTGVQATLVVEEDYHVRGSLRGSGKSPVISPEVDVRDAIDDAIDAVIEKALKASGNVIFTPSGTLSEWHRIASFLQDGGGSFRPGGQH